MGTEKPLDLFLINVNVHVGKVYDITVTSQTCERLIYNCCKPSEAIGFVSDKCKYVGKVYDITVTSQ